LGFVLVICALGVVQIHSATEHTKFSGAHIKQIYWVLAGVGAMFLVSLLIIRPCWSKFTGCTSRAGIAHRGASVRPEVSRGQALDQDARRRTFSALGVGQADPDLAVAKYFADLHERELSWPDFSQGGRDRRFSNVDGTAATGPGDGAHLSACSRHGSVSGRTALEAGADCAAIAGLIVRWPGTKC